MTTKNLGGEGFRWFLGVVEDRNDPLQLGRVRVRIHNIHSPKQSRVSTDTLPWASVMSPVTGTTNNKVGVAPVGIQIGTTVIGFFADGEDGNVPIIMGGLAGIPGVVADNHDVPPEAREINTINKITIGPEPSSAYRAKYPYNKVMRTESGHAIEIDDTPNFERIHIYHKSGTYVEIDEDGRMVTKAAGDKYTIAAKNDTVYVQGNVNVEVKGNVNLTVDGPFTGRASNWNITGDVMVQGNITSSQQVSDAVGTMSSMRSTYNSHTHPDPQGGNVSTPSSTM
jgi:Gp5 N-terminal OB domain